MSNNPDEFETKCPNCGGDLYVVAGTFNSHIPLFKDGFSVTDAKRFDTENETVGCNKCDYCGPLEMVGDAPEKHATNNEDRP